MNAKRDKICHFYKVVLRALDKIVLNHKKARGFQLRNSSFLIVTISPSRSVRCEIKKHPLCGCASKVILKNSKRDTIKVFKPIVKRKEKTMAQKSHSLSHTKWMCSITLCSPLSIDEKSSIINIEVV